MRFVKDGTRMNLLRRLKTISRSENIVLNSLRAMSLRWHIARVGYLRLKKRARNINGHYYLRIMMTMRIVAVVKLLM